MKEWKLSTKEVLVLASELGAKHFYGMRDPFFGMSEEEIRQAYTTALTELEAKGCVSMGFDESVAVEPSLREQIELCAFSEKYVTVDEIRAGVVQPHRVYYVKDSACVLLRQEAEQAVLSMPEGAPAELILESIQEHTDCPAEPEACISQESIQKLPTLSGEEAAALLDSMGCPVQMGKLLAAGLRKKANYCSIGIVNLSGRTLEAVSLVYDDTGILQLQADEELSDQWLVRWQTREQLKQTTAAML